MAAASVPGSGSSRTSWEHSSPRSRNNPSFFLGRGEETAFREEGYPEHRSAPDTYPRSRRLRKPLYGLPMRFLTLPPYAVVLSPQ